MPDLTTTALDRALVAAGIDAAVLASARSKAGADGDFARALEQMTGVGPLQLCEIQAAGPKVSTPVNALLEVSQTAF